jgi:serine/threonine protein kinase
VAAAGAARAAGAAEAAAGASNTTPRSETATSASASASASANASASASASASGNTIGPESFDLLCVIGQGGYGKVLQVRERKSGGIFAMKVVDKKFLAEKKQSRYMKAERDILTRVNHPFLISLRWAFHNPQKVYLVMDYFPGGELFHHLNKQGLLLEEGASFYVAEIVLALEHLHAIDVIHRDLKVYIVHIAAVSVHPACCLLVPTAYCSTQAALWLPTAHLPTAHALAR